MTSQKTDLNSSSALARFNSAIVKPKPQVQVPMEVPMQVPMSPKPKKSPIQAQGTWGDFIILWATHPPTTPNFSL